MKTLSFDAPGHRLPHGRGSVSCSEFVTSGKLENPRRAESCCVLAEFRRIGKSHDSAVIAVDVGLAVGIEANGIGDVERFRTELQCVRLILIGEQVEALGKAQVEAERTLTPNYVARSDLPGQSRGESGQSR